ncbi:isoprenyl transferase [Bartonella sp. LJL80]
MSYPRHIAIIMDGNGRWARARGLPRIAGHRAGMEALHRIVRHAGNQGLEWLTVFAFSSENWSRPADEVSHLMGLLKLFIKRDLAELHSNNVRIHIIGDREGIPSDIGKLLYDAESMTKGNTGLNLVVAFNYGGRNELTRAVKQLIAEVVNGSLQVSDVDDRMIANSLDTCAMPDPDLIIRTSGEQRLSNFLLWQSAYSEFYFSSCYWPDFNEKELEAALADFWSRERRFGTLGSCQHNKEAF